MTLVTGWLPFWIFPFLLAAALGLSVSLYRADRCSCGPLAGWAITILRLFLFASVLFLLLDPALVKTATEQKRGEVLVAIDTSASMAIEDVELETGAISRIEATRRLLSSSWYEDLRNRFEVSLYSLGEKLEPLEKPGKLSLDTSAGTNLGSPILERVLRTPREDLAGVLLISDGNHNAPGDPRQAARALGALGIPIIALGAGSSEPPVDLALEGIEAPRKIFRGDEISAEITLRSSGIEAGELTVNVVEAGKELASFLIEEVPGTGISHWPLRFTIDEPGRHKLSIGFEGVKGEALAENNRGEIWLEVLDDKASVLYLEGSPRWEYRYLKNTWDRDEKISLESHLVPAPPRRKLPADFPRNPEALYEYDAVILGDVEPGLLEPRIQKSLLEYVRDRGGTLILVAGPDAMPAAWRDTPLEELLPVKLSSPPPGRELGARLARDGAALSLTAAGEESELCRLLPGRQRNLELWELLPAPRWYHPVEGAVEGSRPLATAGEGKTPVLISRELGAGKVFYSGIDSTWRWRLRFGDLLYRRFWGQIIRWAVSEQLSAADDSVRLGTDKAVYRFPEDIKISALIEGLRDPGREATLVDAVIRTPPGTQPGARPIRIRLKAVPGSGGRYQGLLSAGQYAPLLRAPGGPGAQAGELELLLDVSTLAGYSSRPDRARLLFAVEPPAENEALGIYCDESNLGEIAELSGGSYRHLSAAGEVIGQLPEKTRSIERTYTYAALDYPWTLALLLISLLAMEWVARKTLKLV
ncbi:MAG: hypothetical protein CMJ91_00195 [Planctomycetes bacterium]|nr:hypothetical protein [Planctomycetota bacterium]